MITVFLSLGSRRSLRHLPLFTAGLLAFALAARAESLQWKQKTIELTADARQEKVETVFGFQNSGAKPVTIQTVKPDCECTVPEMAKKTYRPGEKGELKVVFKLEGRVGLQEKRITVTTDETPDTATMLTLRIDIPELVEIAPRLLVWRVGDKPTEKSVDILLATTPALQIGEVNVGTPGIETRLETIRPNRQYRLFLKPGSTAAPLHSTIFVTTNSLGAEQPSDFTIYARVE